MRKLILLGITLTSLFFNTSAQTYLSEDFETAFTGSPEAPVNWSQTRVSNFGDGIPTILTVSGPRDWQQNTWNGSSWNLVPLSPGTTPTGAQSGTGVLWINDANFASANTASRRMITPVVNLSASTSPYVTFYYWHAATSAAAPIKVMASNDGGSTWAQIMIVVPNFEVTTGSIINSATPWEKINVSIPPAYRTANTKIGIEMVNTASFSQNIFIDNFSIREFTPTTITSAQTGPWMTTTTWVGGVVPTSENNVVIATGHTVNMNANVVRCQNLTVDGTIRYNSTSTTELTQIYGDLTVNLGGTYSSCDPSNFTGKTTYVGRNFTVNGTADFSRGTGSVLFMTGGEPASISGTGTFTSTVLGITGRVDNFANGNGSTVTVNRVITVPRTFSLVAGVLNPNGNLQLGFSGITTIQTIQRGKGTMASAPTFNAGLTSRSYTIGIFTSMMYEPVTLTTGPEIEVITGVPTVTGTWMMNSYNNLALSAPTTLGTATTGGLSLFRGIIITTNTNILTCSPFFTPPTGTAPSITTPSATAGSYIAGPVIWNFPTTFVTRNIPIGEGTAFNTYLPSGNSHRYLTLSPGTNWSSQQFKFSIVGAPSGTTNAPVNLMMGIRAFRIEYLVGSLPVSATLSARYMNYTTPVPGTGDGLLGLVSDVRLCQSAALTGPWTERSLSTGTGSINNNQLYTVTTTTGSPGPINTGEQFFGWGSVGPISDMLASTLVSPVANTCFGTNNTVTVRIRNNALVTINFATDNVTVNANVTGPNPATFPPVVINTGSLAPNATMDVVMSTTYDMTLPGNYVFNASTTLTGDQNTTNDAFAPITVLGQNPTANIGPDQTICDGNIITLNSNAVASGFSSFVQNTDMPINDLTTQSSPLVIANSFNANQISGVVIDTLMHTWDSDMNISLFAPDGSNIDLSSGNGGSGDNYINTVFSNTGPFITSGAAPFTGVFQPEQPFSNLTGSGTGTWNLQIADVAGGDVGTLYKWTLLVPNSITTYAWSPSAGLSSTTVAAPLANPSVTTTYTVVVTDANGCTATDAITITVNPSPTVTLGADQTQCAGTVLLDAGNPGATYAWSTGATTQQITVSTSGTYTVMITEPVNGCTDSDTVNITINPLPVVALGPDVLQCGGFTILDAGNPGASYIWSTSATTQQIFVSTTGTYSVTVTDLNGCSNSDTINVAWFAGINVALGADTTRCGGTVTLDAGNPGSTYAWSESSTTQQITVSTSGTYSVFVTDPNGCTAVDTIDVIINTIPVFTLGPDVTQCGDTVWLDAGNPGSSYAWSTGDTTQIIGATVSGTYSVVATSPQGCSFSDTINVTINPVPLVNLGNDTTLCANSLVLDAGNPGENYLWSTSATTQQITINSAGLYSVVVTNSFGCTDEDTINVTLNILPIANAGPDSSICLGNGIMLMGNGPFSAYNWTDGVISSNQQFVFIAPNQTTSYIYMVTDAAGCTDTDTMTVFVENVPTASFTTTVISAGTISFTNTSQVPPFSSVWDFGDGSPFDFTTSPTHVYANNGTYNVILTVTNDCGSATYFQTIVVAGVGFGESAMLGGLNVYPNPTSGLLNLVIDNPMVDEFKVEITDITGQLIHSLNGKAGGMNVNEQIDLSEIANGVYFMKVNAGGVQQTVRFVISR